MGITLSRIINHGFEMQVRKFEFIHRGDVVLTNAHPSPDFDVRFEYEFREVSKGMAAEMMKNLIINRGFSSREIRD